MDEKAIITLIIPSMQINSDLEIPLDITVLDLIEAINSIYHLGYSESQLNSLYLKSDYPKRLLRGDQLLSKSGLRNGSTLYIWNGSNDTL